MKKTLIYSIIFSICLCFYGLANSDAQKDDSKSKQVLTKKKRVTRITKKKPVLLAPIYEPYELPNNLGDKIKLLFPSTVLMRPDGSAWRPISNFGPFTNGPEFTEIQIYLKNTATITWLWNNYFVNHNDAPIYRKYFQGTFPPTSTATNILHNPGSYPGVTTQEQIKFENILFQLCAISWSSQYGGSVCLEFCLNENTEFEIRNGNTLWDLTKCILRIYVNPQKDSMNPITNGNLSLSDTLMKNKLNIELIPSDRTFQYTITGAATDLRLEKNKEVNQTLLQETLLEVAGRIRGKIASTAFRFVHGFSHSQFQHRIDADDKVVSIELTDNYVDFITRDRLPYMSVHSRFILPYSFTDWFVYTDSGLVVRTDSSYIWKDGHQTPGRSYTVVMEEDRGGWKNHGSWSVERDCDNVIAVDFDIFVSERDALSSDDRFDPFSDWWQLPSCSDLAGHVSNVPEPPKVVDEYSVSHDLILDEEDQGGLIMNYRLLIYWR